MENEPLSDFKSVTLVEKLPLSDLRLVTLVENEPLSVWRASTLPSSVVSLVDTLELSAVKFSAVRLPLTSIEPVNSWVSSDVSPNFVLPLVNIIEALSISVCISWAVSLPPTTMLPVIDASSDIFRFPKDPVEDADPLTSPFLRMRSWVKIFLPIYFKSAILGNL